jgi:hypothetical protein
MEQFENLKWKEIKPSKIKVFQLEEEPEVVYIINIRDSDYMVIHEDGYDLNTGKVEFLTKTKIKEKYHITL